MTSGIDPPYFRFNVSSKVTRCFELRELLRIEIELLRVTIEGARDFRQLDHRRRVRRRTFRQVRIDLLQLAQEPLGFRELIEDRVVRLGELP